ncbi:MAG: hypothetical protein GYA02_05940 [Clostridiaceae bacterium]|nr:hypothetical protein [Clostridiaceae bacterium]
MFTLTSQIQQYIISSWMIDNINNNLLHANDYVDKDYLLSLMTSNNLIKNITIYYENNNYLISPLFSGHLTMNQYKRQFDGMVPDSSYKDPFYTIHVNTANIFSAGGIGAAGVIYPTDSKYLYFVRKIPKVAFLTGSGGAIIISMNENIFHKEIRNFFPVNTEVFLISTDGTILLSSNKSYVFSNLSVSFRIDKSKISSNSDQGNFIEKINGINTLVSYKKLAYSNYIYVAFSPIDKITSNFSILFKILAIITLLTFIIGIVLSFYSVKIYSVPLLFLKNLCSNILNKYCPENKPNNEYDIINYTVDVLANRLNEREVCIKEISPLLFEHILLSLIKESSNTSGKINKLRMAGINFNKSSFIIIIFKVKYDNPVLASNLSKKPEYINREIIELVDNFFGSENIEHISARINGHLLFLLNIEPDYHYSEKYF